MKTHTFFTVCKAFLCLSLFAGCLSDESSSDQQEYTFTYTNLWSSSLSDFPTGGGYENMLLVNHNGDFDLWSSGSVASVGFGEYVEDGHETNLNTLINEAKSDDTVKTYTTHALLTSGTNSITFTLHKDYPYLSLAVGIKPSPDWFLGLDSLKLYADGSWQSGNSGKFVAYDAGIESGSTFNDQSGDVSPRVNIQLLSNSVAHDSDSMPDSFEFIEYSISKN